MADPQLNYGSPDQQTHHVRRSPATWAKLLVVWTIGLAVWAIYLIAILYLWIKLL